MNPRFRSTALAVAVCSCLSAPAFALNVNADGVGQVLLYPYYTVNGGNQTVLFVANSTSRAKAVRVRFREGRNSRPVLDFNVYLSPFDVWTAAIAAPNDNGPAQLYTTDRSCTVPRIANNLATPTSFGAASYTGALSDHPIDQDGTLGTPARTREGHFEVIELGVLQTGEGPAQLAEEVTHNAAGVPRDCDALVAAWAAPNGVWAVDGTSGIDLPSGGLYGSAAVVDVADGTMLAYDATALTRFYTNALVPGNLHRERPPGNTPDLRSADNGNSQVLVDIPPDDTGGAATEAFVTESPAPDPVSLALLRYTLLNDFNTDLTLGAATEWVITFPTKSYYTDVSLPAAVRAPFTDPFRDNGAACEEFTPNFFDREEGVRGMGYGVADIDPPPADDTPYLPPKLCATVNVLAYNQGTGFNVDESAILGSRMANNLYTMQTSGFVIPHGQTLLVLDDPLTAPEDHRMTAPSSARVYAGLPVLGFSVLRVVNANAQPGILASYGGAYKHRGFVRRLSP